MISRRRRRAARTTRRHNGETTRGGKGGKKPECVSLPVCAATCIRVGVCGCVWGGGGVGVVGTAGAIYSRRLT